MAVGRNDSVGWLLGRDRRSESDDRELTAGEAALSVSGRRSPGVGSDELVVLRGKALKFESTELGLQARGLEGRRLGASNIFVVCRALS
jgi:hypothetical protein